MDENFNSCDSDSLIFILDNDVRFIPKRRYISNSAGVIINLSENSYRFLTLLLQGENDKQNIINYVWHEQRGSVSDSSYYGQIYSLRKALDMVGISGSVIKTLPRRGVKYMGKIEVIQEIHDAIAFSPQHEEPLEPPNNSYPVTEVTSSILQDRVYGDNNTVSEAGWMNSRRWNIMVTFMAVIAVCWLTTLVVAIFMFIL